MAKKQQSGRYQQKQEKNLSGDSSQSREVVFTNLNDYSEGYVRQEIIGKFALGLVNAIDGIEIASHQVIVRMRTSDDAAKLVSLVKGRKQKGNREIGVQHGTQGEATDCGSSRLAPYHFVPIKPPVTLLDKPVYHDRLELGDHYTGELRCTLRALTPLLAGNYQFDLGGPEDPGANSERGIVASEEVREAARKLVEKRFQGKVPQQLSSDKKVIEPLIVPRQKEEHFSQPGPVLIPGSQLKGMVRQSLAALLCAPMERVWDRRFSYRPNLQIVSKKEDGPLVRSVVGLVVGDGQADQNSPGRITVYVYELTDIVYVHPDVVEHPEFPKDIKRLVEEKRTNHATYSRRYVNPSALAANAPNPRPCPQPEAGSFVPGILE